MNCAAMIIGINGFERYTLPLIESLQKHEPDVEIIVIDNASERPYPMDACLCWRTGRLSYAKAINYAHRQLVEIHEYDPDWYIVLSNDVLCTGPFAHLLQPLSDNMIVGPHVARNLIFEYLEGWCVAIPRRVWDALGGWDENFIVSSWEDVDFSLSARSNGFGMLHMPDFPFRHLDQKQRFSLIPNYWESERHNLGYLLKKHGIDLRVAE